MKTYFIRLFNYDHFANNIILNAILEAGSPEKAAKLMAHLLAAQQVWLSRCKNETTVTALFPDWKVDTFDKLIDTNHQQWIEYVAALEIVDFEKTVRYQNSKGDHFNNTVSEIITQVINHGTHHRAQIGQHLKLTGLETLPPTDYIFYIRR